MKKQIIISGIIALTAGGCGSQRAMKQENNNQIKSENMENDNNKRVLTQNAALVEEWTIRVSEPHSHGYFFIYSFYDNGQFISERKEFSNVPDFSTTGTYHYQPETDRFFLKFPDSKDYCIQIVNTTHGQTTEIQVPKYYYSWGIDDSGNYYVDEQSGQMPLGRDEIIISKKLK